MNDIFNVQLSRQVRKNLKKLPLPIIIKLQVWIDDVGHRGLSEVRKISGYHDEPLHGDRMGQRSIRLNRSYRAIYIVNKQNLVTFIEIIEINKHAY